VCSTRKEAFTLPRILCHLNRCFEVNSQCFFLRRGLGFILLYPPFPSHSHSSPAALPAMSASSSTLERSRASPRSSHGFPKRHSSPLSNSHTAGSFISPSMDSLIHDSSQPRPSRPRQKGITWNLRWNTNRNSANSSIGLIPPPGEIEKTAGNKAKSLKTPWHHGWRTALFGTCMPSTRSSL